VRSTIAKAQERTQRRFSGQEGGEGCVTRHQLAAATAEQPTEQITETALPASAEQPTEQITETAAGGTASLRAGA
jgi:DNA gyrase inhibitor GyrI